MTYTLADLLSPPTEPQVQATLLAALTSVGFPVTSWPSGGAGRTLVQAFARVLADGLGLVSNVARGGLLDLAPGTDPGSPGDWLTLYAASHYGLARRAASFAVTKVRLAVASGAGPYTITPGQLWAVSTTGRRFNSANTVNVPASAGPSTVDLEMRAESPGAAYNLALGTTLTLETPLPGVSVTTIESAGGSGTAMVIAGTDPERDTALRARCRSRWATIGLQHTAAAYDALARQVPSVGDPLLSLVTRTRIDDTNPRGAGTANVWIAGDSGPLSSPEEAAVRAYLLARKSITADLQVQNATAVPVNVAAVLKVRNNSNASVEATERVTASINAVPIGDAVRLYQLVEELMGPAGVFDVVITAPVANVVLAANQVATVGTLAITQVNS